MCLPDTLDPRGLKGASDEQESAGVAAEDCGPGHARISTTQIYAQVGDAALVGAILTRSHGS